MKRLLFKWPEFSLGQRFITVYFAVTYWFPIVGWILFKEHIVSIYKIYPLDLYSLSLIFLVYFLYLWFDSLRISFLPKPNFSVFNNLFNLVSNVYLKSRLYIGLFSISIIVLSCYFSFDLNDYRYARTSLSERSPYFIFLIILTTIITVDLFYCLFVKPHNQKQTIREYIETILLSSSLLMLSNGTAVAFLALIALFYSFSPKLFRSIFSSKKEDGILKRIVKFGYSSVIIMIIFMMAWCYGETIKSNFHKSIANMPAKAIVVNINSGMINIVDKINLVVTEMPKVVGEVSTKIATRVSHLVETINKNLIRITVKSDQVVSVMTSASALSPAPTSVSAIVSVSAPSGYAIASLKKNATEYLYYLIESSAISYHSLLMTTESPRGTLKNGAASPLLFPLKTFLFRINHVFGGIFDVKKPEITSISQLNYQLLAEHPNDVRQGSSPGLLGSFNYAFKFPFNLIFCVLYLLFLSRVVETLLYQKNGDVLSMPGVLLLFVYLQAFFQSPFDFLLIIDNCVIYILLILGIYMKKNNMVEQTGSFLQTSNLPISA